MRDHTLDRNGRLRRVKRKIRASGLDAYLVTGEKDIIYLAGYYTEGARLLVPAKTGPVYFIDSMNETLGREKLEKLGLEKIIAGPAAGNFKRFVKTRKLRRIGIDENKLSAFEYGALKRGGSSAFRHIPSVIGDMRVIKQEYELNKIRKAARETVRIWSEVNRRVRTGMAEKDIGVMVDVLIRSRGYDNAFYPVVAVAENTAYPHAVAGSRRMERNEHLLVDFGLRVEGYCSDLTRVYSNGRINRKIAYFRKHVREAHDRAIKMVKPGMTTGRLDEAVRKYFHHNNIEGKHVLHSLGHGIGLDVHERPFFRKGSSERLRKGMVITIEPGLYEPGLGGIREEDMVLVTEKGCEVLTR